MTAVGADVEQSGEELGASLQRISKKLDHLERRLREDSAREKAPKTTDRFKLVTDTITTLAVIFGLGFSYLEVEHWRKTNDASQWNELSKKWLELDRYFVEHPDMRKYFYDHAELPADPTEQSKVVAVSYYALDFADWVLTTFDMSILDGASPEGKRQKAGWTTYFQNTLFKSPAICRLLLQSPESYGDTTSSVGGKACKSR